MKIKKVLTSALIGVFAFSLATAGVSARQDNASNKKNSSAKQEKVKQLKNFEKASAGKNNSQVHKEKVEKVTGNLKKIANEQSLVKEVREVAVTNEVATEEPSSEEISEGITIVAVDVESTIEETSTAIEEVESRNKFKKLLIGTDYKNLGQLRSTMVKNRNQIRQLTRLSESAEGEIKTQIETQLATLTEEQERINTVIKENESGFSILGWVVKFFSGYSNDTETDIAEADKFVDDIATVLVGEDEESAPAEDEAIDETNVVSEEDVTEGDTTESTEESEQTLN